jgi:cell division protein FtsW
MIIVMVLFFMMFLAGVPKKLLLVSVSVAAAIGTWLVLSSPYRHARLMTFLDPWSDPGGRGFQVIQSMVGLHNGQFSGTGLGNGKEKLFYLPEAHNDFIFAVIGEELGFIGVASVMAAYLYFIYRGLKIASDCHQKYGDVFGALLAAGITLALGLQGFVNMAVVLGALPTKGLTLPFISYGGTALFVDLFAVGTLLSIARGPKKGTSGCDRLKT